jgi:hypothetical protein
MPLKCQSLLMMLLACLVFALSASQAVARIKPPSMEELVDSADLIVIGKVQSLKATPPVIWRQIGRSALVVAGIAISALLLWRKQVVNALVVIGIFGIGFAAWDVPHDAYRKVADVSVSSAIKGAPPAADIPVYYETGFVCDVTQLVAGREYMLFLKDAPGGYTMSWFDYSQWAIKDGCAQTVRMTWRDAPAITVSDLIERIRGGAKQGKNGSTAVSDPYPKHPAANKAHLQRRCATACGGK